MIALYGTKIKYTTAFYTESFRIYAWNNRSRETSEKTTGGPFEPPRKY